MAIADMLEKIKNQDGFIAALDQSGGSTPKALNLYGISENEYQGDEQMFALVHQMRTRIITSDVFTGSRVLAAILFENTLDRKIAGQGSAQYLWQKKNIVPFLKVDKGLSSEENGVQLMKPLPDLDALLEKACEQQVFGTKMRSVIKLANEQGISEVVEQQFAIAKQILAKGLTPIIEPEIDIHSPDKAAAEALLKTALLKQLDALACLSANKNQQVMLKLTLPEAANFYRECIEHASVLKVVALSGGYNRAQANEKVQANHGMIASFSRALTEGLSQKQTDQDFNLALDDAIESIFQASKR